MKYDAVAGIAKKLAEAMAPLIPPDALVLVPVPRSGVRRMHYGVDQSVLLAMGLSQIAGLRTSRSLRAPVWRVPHAGHGRKARRANRFRQRAEPNLEGILLIDDVLTTGTTLGSAAQAAGRGVIGCLTFTMSVSAGRPTEDAKVPIRPA
ncbi:MAG TPA: ComF family protein [Actinobacteria bacterium]|nr:ComF family protein [Actinomycetota bacterium]